MMMLFDQSVTAPCIVAAKETSSLWSAWFPGIAGVIIGFSLSELASYLKRRSDRKREYRKFLADQANRLMEDIVKVFFSAKNELGYLASELSQMDENIQVAEKRARLLFMATHNLGSEELDRLRQARSGYIDEAYRNLKKYHAEGEPSVKLLCSMPLKTDLSFLERFLSEVTEGYHLDAEGVRMQCELYQKLHDEFISVRKRLLDELLSSIKD